MLLPGPVVDAPWLAAALASDTPPVVVDVRWYLTPPGAEPRSGRAAYETGHIPGAVFVDLDADLAGPPGPRGRHPLPDPGPFASAMARVGIGDDDAVVAYDDAGGVVAARLWWMLRATGRDAAVLDGGIEAWPGPLVSGVETRPAAAFTARPWPDASVAGVEDVDADGVVVLDARAPERFRGEVEPVDPRPGHIPGARNAPSSTLLDPATGRFLPADALRARFADLGVGAGADVVAYCGSGVTACHTLLALDVAGLGPGRLYPGSWSEWSSDPTRPVAVDQ